VTCIIANLGTDNQETINLDVTATGSSRTIVNRARAQNADGSVSSTAVTTIVEPADLSVTKTSIPAEVRRGDAILYVIRVRNTGPNPAENVTLTDVLPDEVDFREVLPATCNQAGGTVECDLGTIASGDTRTVRILARASENGTAVNTVDVTSDNDPNQGNNDATASTEISNDGNYNDPDDPDDPNDPDSPFSPFNPDSPFFDEDLVEEFEDDFFTQEEQYEDAENDLDEDGEVTTDQYEDEGDDLGDDDSPVSANADEDGAEASTPGAVASTGGDPDELEPVTDPLGDVEDEIPTSGPLPNTGGVSLWVYGLPLLGFLFLAAAVVRKLKGDG